MGTRDIESFVKGQSKLKKVTKNKTRDEKKSKFKNYTEFLLFSTKKNIYIHYVQLEHG